MAPAADHAAAGGGSGTGARDVLDLSTAGNAEVAEMMRKFKGKGEVGDDSQPTPPEQAAGRFQMFQGFSMELLAGEPAIAQPLYLSFDHRGRMWVVQYRQYPMPAGLKVVKYDQYLRAVFDKVPEPPPHGVKGLDRISVLEDTDGDGRYESVRDVITGLNIVSSVVVGRGRIWVLNPPYLLSYADADDDGVPEGDPRVEISGFGLEDTHSVANSMRWGPDGWLYGANGSTTTATVTTAATRALHFKGQCLWRFHPESKVFEIFAEGGGNTFSTEFDAKGRAFSGTNNGATRGMHYAQGMYGAKNWGKHGPLTNPYAFGFFDHMKHEGFTERFPQTFMIYEGGAWPASYHHAVISANALHNRVQASQLIPDASTWRTRDTDLLAITPDRWFRPVDLKDGPDGNVYLADWYDSRLTHVDPRDNWHKASGRLYRLRHESARPVKPFNLAAQSSVELLAHFASPNKWLRQTTQRVLADRRDPAVVAPALKLLDEGSDQQALEALWAIHSAGGLSDELALRALDHADPHVRLWTARLIGDRRVCSPAVAEKLALMACNDPNIEVRSQLACTAKRLPGAAALPIIRGLALHAPDAADPRLPMLIWWALESKAESDRQAVVAMMEDRSFWPQPIVEKFLVGRLMQRYALAGSPQDLLTCAKLLELSPDAKFTRLLVEGMDEAFKGRSISHLPPTLAQALASADGGARGVSLALRQGDKAALAKALKTIGDESASKSERLDYIEILGQVPQPGASAVLLKALRSPSHSIRRTALAALRAYDEPAIGKTISALLHTALPDEQGVRAAALATLTSRPAWSLDLLAEVAESRLKPSQVPLDLVRLMKLHRDARVDAMIDKHWGKLRGAPPQEKLQQIERVAALARAGGDPRTGKALFTGLCAACHSLFNEGGAIGPDLTGYERTNLDFLVPALVDPSMAIREEFTAFVILTTDGRTLTGFLGDQNDRTVAIKGVDNVTTTLPRERIASLNALPVSLMPEGLLNALSDQQIKDLMAYLTSPTPIGR
jgi:putative heme-binding domain-containing protein